MAVPKKKTKAAASDATTIKPIRVVPKNVKGVAGSELRDTKAAESTAAPEDDVLEGPASAPASVIEAEVDAVPDDEELMDDDLNDLADLDDERPIVATLPPAEPAPIMDPAPEPVSEAPVPAEPKAKKTKAASVAPTPAPVLVAKGGTIIVSRHYPQDETEDVEGVEVRTFATTPATVSVQYGATVNLGDFQSAKVSVQISLPCYTEEIEGAYRFASEMAESRLKMEVDAIHAAKSGGKAPSAAAAKTAIKAAAKPAPVDPDDDDFDSLPDLD